MNLQRPLPQVGLDVIKRKGSVLQCHKDMAEMVTLSEIGMSKAILEAGYNLDSLMLRYQVGPASCHVSHKGA
jgi:hypothetical protein